MGTESMGGAKYFVTFIDNCRESRESIRSTYEEIPNR